VLEAQTFGVQEQAFQSGRADAAVESGVAVVVTTAGGNGKFPAIFLATPHVPAGIYAMLPAEFQPAMAGFCACNGRFSDGEGG